MKALVCCNRIRFTIVAFKLAIVHVFREVTAKNGLRTSNLTKRCVRLPIRPMNSKGWRGLVSAVAPGGGKALFPGVLLAATVFVASISQSLAQSESSQSRLSLNTRIGFNIKAEFKNVGGIGQNNPGPATGVVDRFYDDGFNRVDISGN